MTGSYSGGLPWRQASLSQPPLAAFLISVVAPKEKPVLEELVFSLPRSSLHHLSGVCEIIALGKAEAGTEKPTMNIIDLLKDQNSRMT